MNYTFELLDSTTTTSELPQDLATVAGSIAGSLWVPVVLLIGIYGGFMILDWIIEKFKPVTPPVDDHVEDVYKVGETKSETDIVMGK